MSSQTVSDILNSVDRFDKSKFEQFYQELTALRLKKNGLPLLNAVESQLLNKINSEFDQKKWDRLTYLDWKLEFGALTAKEETESLKLAEAYEHYSVERLKYLSQLALIRQVSIDKLMEQLGINTKVDG
jgi:ABC-type phosphate transport system auxiliary subunit